MLRAATLTRWIWSRMSHTHHPPTCICGGDLLLITALSDLASTFANFSIWARSVHTHQHTFACIYYYVSVCVYMKLGLHTCFVYKHTPVPIMPE